MKTGLRPFQKATGNPYHQQSHTSRDVKQIQTLLALLKFNPGPIDGIFGQKTEKAIKAFQLDIGVPVTGKIDENLKSQLDGAYKSVVILNREKPEENKVSPEENKAELKESALRGHQSLLRAGPERIKNTGSKTGRRRGVTKRA